MTAKLFVIKYFLNIGEIEDSHTTEQIRSCPMFSCKMQEYQARLLFVEYKPANGRDDANADARYIIENLQRKYGKHNIRGLVVYTDEMCTNPLFTN